MTIHTRHLRAAGNPAPARGELLDLAYGTVSRVLAVVDEVRHEIVEVVTRLEVEYGTISVFDAGVAFEMTDAAGAVSLLRRESHGVDDRCPSAGCKMLAAVAVATLTGNADVFKG